MNSRQHQQRVSLLVWTKDTLPFVWATWRQVEVEGVQNMGASLQCATLIASGIPSGKSPDSVLDQLEEVFPQHCWGKT